jgi:N-acylneuraminate cytidylyltransferase
LKEVGNVHQSPRTVAFIPARGGSKSIPLKNIREIAGKPLIYWVIEAALGCPDIETVYVATDSDKIARCVEATNQSRVVVIARSPATCTDEASSESALLEFCEGRDFEQVFFIQATSPLLTSADLSNAWETYRCSGCDSLLSLVRQKRFVWRASKEGLASPVNYDPLQRPRRQEFAGYLMENGAFYISKRSRILDSQCRISGRIGFYEMPEETAVEIDEPVDWIVTEQILLDREQKKKRQLLTNVRMLVMDIDGVLTDSGMYYSETGDEMKKFSTRDGKGIELIQQAGFATGIITSENVQMVRRRADKLKIKYVMTGIRDKEAALRQMAAEAGRTPQEILYVGDDVNDLPAINIAGISACPSDAVAAVKQRADWVCHNRGGQGAVREICDMLLRLRVTESEGR